MDLQINCTNEGISDYPLHNHTNYEIIYYVNGEGYLKTEGIPIPYTPGTIIIVPPGLSHGSTSKNGFKNISINGSFHHLLNFDEPVVMHDNEKNEGRSLTQLLYNNRLGNMDFLNSLCDAYVKFLLSNLLIDNNIDIAINQIISKISSDAYDANLNLKETLVKSGYAEDYIRSQFKQKTGKTPTQFLTEIRINRACYLLGIYNDNCSIMQIAEQCGFVDYIYFSKRFKQITGVSPREYKNRL